MLVCIGVNRELEQECFSDCDRDQEKPNRNGTVATQMYQSVNKENIHTIQHNNCLSSNSFVSLVALTFQHTHTYDQITTQFKNPILMMIVSNSNTFSKNKILVPVEKRNICCFFLSSVHQNINVLYSFGQQQRQCDEGARISFSSLVVLSATFIIIQCECACRFISFKKSNKHLNETMLLEFRVHQRLASAGSHFLCVHASLCNVLYICILAWFCLFFGNRGFFFQIYVRNPLTLKQSDK